MPQSPQRVEFEGQVHEFPPDFTDADIQKALTSHAPARVGPAAPQGEPQASGFLPSVAQFVEGKSPWYQDADPFTAKVKQSLSPLNVGKNMYEGAKGVVTTVGSMGKDLLSNPNWFQTMPAGQRPSTMQRFVTDPAKAEWAKGQQTTGLESAGHYLASVVPWLGPVAASLGEQAGKGDIGGAAAQAVGMYLGGKVTGKVGEKIIDLPKDSMDFVRRAKSLNDVNKAAAGTYQQSVQVPIKTLMGRIQAEGAKTVKGLVDADNAATNGQGTIPTASVVAKSAQALEDTGYQPTPGERALLGKAANPAQVAPVVDQTAKSYFGKAYSDLSSEQQEALHRMLPPDLVPKNTGVTFDQLLKMRSDIGNAAARAYRAGNAKLDMVLQSQYDALTELAAERAKELGGAEGTKAWSHYNNEFKAYFELKRTGISADMLDDIGDRHEAVPKLQKFANADLTEIQEQMKKYKMDTGALDRAQRDARSVTEADKVMRGSFIKSAYRVLAAGGAGAAVAGGVIASAHGAGIYGMVPLAIASYFGSKAAGLPPLMETGEILRRLRVDPEATPWQVRTPVEGPQDFQIPKQTPAQPTTPPQAPAPTKAGQIAQVKSAKGAAPAATTPLQQFQQNNPGSNVVVTPESVRPGPGGGAKRSTAIQGEVLPKETAPRQPQTSIPPVDKETGTNDYIKPVTSEETGKPMYEAFVRENGKDLTLGQFTTRAAAQKNIDSFRGRDVPGPKAPQVVEGKTAKSDYAGGDWKYADKVSKARGMRASAEKAAQIKQIKNAKKP